MRASGGLPPAGAGLVFALSGCVLSTPLGGLGGAQGEAQTSGAKTGSEASGPVGDASPESATLSDTAADGGTNTPPPGSTDTTAGQASSSSSSSSTEDPFVEETWGGSWGTTGGSGGEWLPGDDRPGGHLEPNEGERAAKNCSGPNSWRTIAPQSPRVFIAGVYEAAGDDGSSGAATIRWGIPGDNILIVAGYHPVAWTITLVGNGNVAEVIAAGRESQTIAAPPGVITEEFLGDDGIAGDALLSNGLDLLEFAEDTTGLTAYGFDGCYETNIFAFNE